MEAELEYVAFAHVKYFAAVQPYCEVDEIRNVYGWSKEEVGGVVFKHPQFASLDHERVECYVWYAAA